MNTLRILVLALIGAFLSACSSSFDDGGPLRGVFIDSAVEGLEYTAGSYSGTTDSEGAFQYEDGDTVVFSIGSMVFPSVTGSSTLSPLDMAQGAALESDVIVNIARLIQSLDADGDNTNGIMIPSTAKDVASPINFDVPAAEFELNADVINLVANSGSVTTALISSELALDHLYDSLGIPNPTMNSVAALAGYWNSDENDDYILISAIGGVTFYDFDAIDTCYTTRVGSLSQIQDTLYLLESEGESTQVVITRTGDTLNILLVGTFTLETSTTGDDLTAC